MTFTQIFNHSIKMLAENFTAAIKISAVVFIAIIFLTTALNVLFLGQLHLPPIEPAGPDASPEELARVAQETSKLMAPLFLSFLLQIIGYSWIAVAWHRYFLLGDMPSDVVPSWDANRVMSYFGKSLLLGLVVVAVVLIPVIVVAGILAAIGAVGLSNVASMAIAFSVGFYAFYRFGMILPATATDQELTLKQSLERTEPYKQAIWGLVFANIAIVIVTAIIGGALAFDNVIGVILPALIQWALMMVSISFLTTIYKDSEGR